MFPLWKSATLSPDSIECRVDWTGCAIGTPLLFLSQFPDWPRGLFFAGGAAVALLAIAFQWTNHIKINGRIYSAFNNNRRPDRPAFALAVKVEGWAWLIGRAGCSALTR